MKTSVMLFVLSGVSALDASQRLLDIDGAKIVAEISPDGSLAAWSHTVDGDSDIYLSKPDGSDPRNLTPLCNSWDVSPSWTPDGKGIVFKSYRDGYQQAFLTDLKGKQLRRLTTSDHHIRFPRFNADGNLAVLSLHKDARHPHFRRSDLAVIKDGEWALMVKDKMIIDYAWSPDGRQIACGTEDEVIITNISNGESRSFQISEIDSQLYRHGCIDLRWQPDGTAVACLIRYLGRRVSPETVLPGEDRFYLLSMTNTPRSVALNATRGDPFKWVRFRPDIAVQLDAEPVDPRAEKQRVRTFFERQGFPLKEIKPPGNVIEYGFEVGPDGRYAIGINILLTEEEEKLYQRGHPRSIAIPAHVEKDIVLWQWDLKANGNGDPGFRRLYAQLLDVLKEYPGK